MLFLRAKEEEELGEPRHRRARSRCRRLAPRLRRQVLRRSSAHAERQQQARDGLMGVQNCTGCS